MPGIANDIFDTKEEAMERAKELGVNEIHQHKIINNSGNEDIIFMPYKSHQEYERKEGAKRNLGDNSPFNVEDFGAETCPMCKNDNPIIGGEVCAECTQYLEDEQDRFSQRYDAESYDDESPMMKNITVIGAFALAIIIGKKLKR